MIKVMTIVGTRPEIIKLNRVISEMEKFTDAILVHLSPKTMTSSLMSSFSMN